MGLSRVQSQASVKTNEVTYKQFSTKILTKLRYD